MNAESWFGKLKKHRERKKLEKLRREFSFLTDTINSNYTQLAEEVKYYESEMRDTLFEIKKKIDDVSVAGEKYRDNMEHSLEQFTDTTYNNIAITSDKVISIVDERFSLIQSGINENQTEFEKTNDEVKRLLKTITVQIDNIQRDTQGGIEASNAVIEDKATGILLSIEEVKTLMKIVAVNSLVDEISKGEL